MGFDPYKMDQKFRVSVPPEWRPAYGAPMILLFSKKYDLPVVKCISQEIYEEKMTRVKESEKTPKEKDKLLERLAMLSRRSSLNDQGKVLVAKDLAEQVGIEADGDVVLAGRNRYFEIWAKHHFDAMLKIESGEDFDDDLGIF
jgi:DNA-binding transcriptional regulator/RsmH inhibitor MraZ